jgi:HJR/Mrr/RecB family endonuclease
MPVAIDDEILQRFTGQIAVRDPALAQASFDADHHRLLLADRQLRRARQTLFYRSLRMLPIHLRAEPWVIALAVSGIMAFSVPLLLFFTFAVDKGLVVALIPVLFLAIGGAILALFWDRDGETPETRADVRRALVVQAREVVRKISAEAAGLRQHAEQSGALLLGIRQAIEYPVTRLLNARCDAMDGTQFEIYLAEIFTLLGYAVERLGGSGDQGVDLILTRGTIRIAVQAKCYTNPLGNAPIQEVYAGRMIHRCERWAVVTNSSFTTGGREAATATGTILIEGAQLPALIRGKIML